MQKIEERRTKESEFAIRRIYKELLQDLREFIGVEYATLAEDDKLTYEILQRKGQYARFLEEFERRINNITPEASNEIRKLVEEIYGMSYEGMVNAVEKSPDLKSLKETLSEVKMISPEVIREAVENPVSGLTLSDVLEKSRKEIIYNVKRDITNGLLNGDRMSSMARRIATSVDNNYRKSVNIARTEVHRVREAGHQDAAKELNSVIGEGTTSLQMVKTWRSMKDSRVRKTSKANHRKMDGVTIPVDEYFDLGHGVKTKAPGQSGVAAHDCNCRCYLSYDLKEMPKNEQEEQFTYESFKKMANAGDFELTENVKDMYLTDSARKRINKAVEKVNTAQDFKAYLEGQGIKLEISSKALLERMDDKIPMVKKQMDFIISAIESYKEIGGLSKLKTIHFFDPDLDVIAQYVYRAIGEGEVEDEGHVYFSNRINGFHVMHEFAHILADSTKPAGEDAVTWSKKLNKLAKMDEKQGAYFGASSEAYEAERLADAVGGAFAYGKKDKREFLARLANVIKKRQKKNNK